MNWTSLVSTLEHAAVAAVAVAVTYMVQHVTASDFGAYGPAIVGVLTVVAGLVKNLVSGSTPTN